MRDLIVLDLDKTLVDSTEPDSMGEYQVVKRPGVDMFITILSHYYDIAVWTAANLSHMNKVRLALDNNIERSIFWWYDKMCDIDSKGSYIKTLGKVYARYPYANVYLIDDNDYIAKMNQFVYSMLHIVPYSLKNDKDRELFKLGSLIQRYRGNYFDKILLAYNSTRR